jgi:hypothetical protein
MTAGASHSPESGRDTALSAHIENVMADTLATNLAKAGLENIVAARAILDRDRGSGVNKAVYDYCTSHGYTDLERVEAQSYTWPGNRIADLAGCADLGASCGPLFSGIKTVPGVQFIGQMSGNTDRLAVPFSNMRRFYDLTNMSEARKRASPVESFPYREIDLDHLDPGMGLPDPAYEEMRRVKVRFSSGFPEVDVVEEWTFYPDAVANLYAASDQLDHFKNTTVSLGAVRTDYGLESR